MYGKYFSALSLIFFLLLSPADTIGQNLKTSHLQWNLSTYNQAALTSNHFAHFTVDYRQAKLQQNIKFSNASFWGDYPILLNDKNIGAIFFQVENENSGSENKFKRFRSNFAISKKVYLNQQSFFSFGLGVEYQQQTLSLDNLTTGSQFVEGLGFNRSLENGENSDFYQSTYFAINSGLYLEATDYQKSKWLKIGLSVNNINKPIKSWEGIEYPQPLMWSSQAQYLTFISPTFAIGPEAFLFKEGTAYNGIGGITGRYYLGGAVSASFDEEYENQYINIFGRIATQRKVILGMQYRKENYLVGFSSDIAFGGLSPYYESAFEIVFSFIPKIKGNRTKNKRVKNIPDKEVNSRNTPAHSTANTEATVDKGNKPIKISVDPAKIKVETDSVDHEKENEMTGNMNPGAIESEEVEFPVDMNPVYFIFGSSELDQSSQKYLQNLYEEYLKGKNRRIQLVGHTDDVGSSSYNHSLSIKRAEQVKSYLIGLGLPNDQILIDGKGDQEPLNSNHTEEERARNRRVEIKIIQ